MDEPTNDLDVETLELLEELLIDYPGTLILVSHDRAFLDNVVTSSLVMEGNGRVGDYVGGYSDWLRQKPVAGEARQRGPALDAGSGKAGQRDAGRGAGSRRSASSTSRTSASWKHCRSPIEGLEGQVAAATAEMNTAGFYQQGSAEVLAANRKLADLHAQLDKCYARWSELE